MLTDISEDSMLSVNCLTILVKPFKILSTVRIDISVDFSFQSNQNPVDSGS